MNYHPDSRGAHCCLLWLCGNLSSQRRPWWHGSCHGPNVPCCAHQARSWGHLRNPLASFCLSRAICCPPASCRPYQWSPRGTQVHKASISNPLAKRGKGRKGPVWPGLKVTVSSLALPECFRDLRGEKTDSAVCSQNKQSTLPHHKTTPAAAQRWVGPPRCDQERFPGLSPSAQIGST